MYLFEFMMENNNDEKNQEHVLELLDIGTLDGSSVSSLSDVDYDEESTVISSHSHGKVSMVKTSNHETDSHYISDLEQRIMNLVEKNKELRSDKAVLKVDLLETQHETRCIIRNLKRQIFGLKEAKALEEKELLNIIISQEHKMKEDQVRFLELFATKDKEIAKLQKKLRSKRKSKKVCNNEVEAIAPPLTTSPSVSPSQSTASTILEHFEGSKHDDLITVNGRKEHLDKFPNVAKTKRVGKNKLYSIKSNDESLVDQMKGKISSQYSSIGRRLLSKSTYQKIGGSEQNDLIIEGYDDQQNNEKVSILLEERDRNAELMAKMQRTIETLCEALQRRELEKKDNVEIHSGNNIGLEKNSRQQVVEL